MRQVRAVCGQDMRAEVPTQAVTVRLREDEAALLKEACERLRVLPGRLLGRMIRAAFAREPVEGGEGWSWGCLKVQSGTELACGWGVEGAPCLSALDSSWTRGTKNDK